ncbi:MAG: hypothetical protein KC645_19710, partial [Gemmatimonadetes bacterium]|nr:hypothetical protein [Gemmatimonadota bacterium]
AGVQITESTQAVWAPGDEWRVAQTPLVDLAATGSGGQSEFFRVRDAARLSDGRLVVANAGTNEVRLYGTDGGFLTSIGRTGQGPGEFERLTSVHSYRGDSIAVFDYWARRLTVLDSAGTVSRTASVEVDGGALRDIHPLPDGRFLLETAAIAAMTGAKGRMRIPAPVLLLSADGAEEDTLAVLRGFDTYVFEGGDARPPLPQQLFIATRGGAVYFGEGEEFEFRTLDLRGALRAIGRLPGYRLAVPQVERDSIRDAMLQQELPARLRPIMEAMAEAVPDRHAAYSGLTVDPTGHVWVQEYTPTVGLSESPRRWLVFDPDGVWLGTVVGPPNFDLYEVGTDYLLGRARDALEVETVQVLRLER